MKPMTGIAIRTSLGNIRSALGLPKYVTLKSVEQPADPTILEGMVTLHFEFPEGTITMDDIHNALRSRREADATDIAKSASARLS